jgi:hypothetical protein
MAAGTDKTAELLQAVLAADDERRNQALRVLRGEFSVGNGQTAEVCGPLLLGVGAGAKFLGVSRATLWRAICAGRIGKVELFPGSFRVRREDLVALARGRAKCGARNAECGVGSGHGQNGRCGGECSRGGAGAQRRESAKGREGDGRGEI